MKYRHDQKCVIENRDYHCQIASDVLGSYCNDVLLACIYKNGYLINSDDNKLFTNEERQSILDTLYSYESCISYFFTK